MTVNTVTHACTGQKCMLAGWKTANGFDAGGDTVAYYYNAGDLGLGREMHCLQRGADAACYVTNYGHNFPPAAEPNSAIADAIGHNNAIATVAMEYSASGGSTGVKFYVYLHSSGDTLVNQAILDSELAKNSPHLCLNCHGGVYNSTNHTVEGATFLPFDVFSFKYDTVSGYSLSNQQENFRLLNKLVVATHPNATNGNNPIVSFINGLYPCGVNNPGCNAVDTPYTPSGWAVKPALYQTINRPYCRTCHISIDSGRDWTQYSQWNPNFKTPIQSRVCTANVHSMPHAEVPYKKFWFSTSPRAPDYLADATTGLGFGTCPP